MQHGGCLSLSIRRNRGFQKQSSIDVSNMHYGIFSPLRIWLAVQACTIAKKPPQSALLRQTEPK